MKSIVISGIILTFSILFISSSGVIKGQAFAYQQKAGDNYYYEDDYLQGYDREYTKDPLYGLDKEFLEGIDEKALFNIAQNLLKNLDFEALNEQLLQDGDALSSFLLILVLFILLVIVGAGFG